MAKTISLFGILSLNCLFFAAFIMLSIAKWGMIDPQTLTLFIIGCFIMGLWNATVLIDSMWQKSRKK
ncbi:hypothetical protein [Alkalicoccobacillus porphyridii]|uniref:Uncharacterized protein n=1 Tax=Alkalicoccobacillus porphyridii TaxID=2597270 RepID=A0A553ZZS9_9BACI|nr:hypothetical protein [Alkalicoccobacillus porphyridii]TSB46933.1 hypothetical protein FN960_07900 [Alkalicoccobacillus porphyridii]